jgi:hypothetical protein
MKIPTTEEYILEISDLINTQNKRVKKYLSVEVEKKQQSSAKYIDVISKFEQIKKYVSNEMLSALNNINGNDRYVFSIVDGVLDENKSQYFKLIIKNKTSNNTNFVILTNDVYDFFIKLKTPNSTDDLDTYIKTFPVQKFTKGWYRKVFFEYLQEIIKLDTLPKLKRKSQETESIDKIISLNAEIDRMRKISERNKNMLIESISKQALLKQNKEKNSDNNNE